MTGLPRPSWRRRPCMTTLSIWNGPVRTEPLRVARGGVDCKCNPDQEITKDFNTQTATQLCSPFTIARKRENLPRLSPPSDYDTYAPVKKLLWLLNAERKDRAVVEQYPGINSSDQLPGGAFLSWSAMTHAGVLANFYSFILPGAGLAHANAIEGSMSDRLKTLPGPHLWEPLSPGFWNTQTGKGPSPTDEAEADAQNPESAIYSLIYNDAPDWGHRHGLLGIGDPDHCTRWAGVGYWPSPGLTKHNNLPLGSEQGVYVIDTVGNKQTGPPPPPLPNNTQDSDWSNWSPPSPPATTLPLPIQGLTVNYYQSTDPAKIKLLMNVSYPNYVMGTFEGAKSITVYPGTNWGKALTPNDCFPGVSCPATLGSPPFQAGGVACTPTRIPVKGAVGAASCDIEVTIPPNRPPNFTAVATDIFGAAVLAVCPYASSNTCSSNPKFLLPRP